jgi:hypothetical protein
MAATQSTDLAGTVYAKVIETLLVAYQYDDVVALPYFRYKSIIDQPTNTAGFPRKVKNATASVATETTVIGTTGMTTTNVDIAVSRVGIAREITATAQEDSIIGNALYTQGFVEDAAVLFGEAMDTDATALFGSITAVAGSSGVAITLATMVALVASQRANKAKGTQIIEMHDLQLKQLQTAQLAATATPWAVFFQPSADNSQFGGYWMNAPVWASSKNPTANTGVDRLGCAWSQGQSAGGKPQFCAFAFVMKRMPSSLTQPDVLMDGSIWASFTRYGVGIPANNFATKLVSTNA